MKIETFFVGVIIYHKEIQDFLIQLNSIHPIFVPLSVLFGIIIFNSKD